MSKEFLVEIGVEEMPARHCEDIAESQLSPNILKGFADNCNLKFDDLKLFVTPRRIIFYAQSVDFLMETQSVRGPIVSVAVDKNGKYTEIAKKWVNANGIDFKDVDRELYNDKEFLYFEKRFSKEDLVNSIQSFLERTISSIRFDRPMRWAGSKMVFSRPIRSITAFIDKTKLEIELWGISSGTEVFAPRYVNKNRYKVNSVGSYFTEAKKVSLVFDQGKRREYIQKYLASLSKNGLMAKEGLDGLITEIVYLTENPFPVLCEFEEEFLKLPKEVIEAVLIKHQRYIPLYETKTKKLTNKFVVVLNHDHETEGMKYGNQKVVRARLSDGVFFYEQDLKHDLDYFNKQIKNITFQEKLGSLQDKVDRVGKIIENLRETAKFDKNKALEAAKYSKADLATTLVSEFSSLEGVVGKVYANRMGIDAEVASALEEYYRPRSSGDVLPKTETAIVLALADKIDTLYGLMSVGLKPKGNSDPYGLRRAGITVARLLWESEFAITLEDLIKAAAEVHKSKVDTVELKQFVFDRLEQEIRGQYDDIDVKLMKAVIYNADDNFSSKKTALNELSKLATTSKFYDFMEFAKRVYNITVKQNIKGTAKVDLTKLNPSEKSLYKAAVDMCENGFTVVDLLNITSLGNEFFVKNMIMSENQNERERRLNILGQVYIVIAHKINLDIYLHKATS